MSVDYFVFLNKCKHWGLKEIRIYSPPRKTLDQSAGQARKISIEPGTKEASAHRLGFVFLFSYIYT